MPRCGSSIVSLKKVSGYATGRVRAIKRLKAGIRSSVSGTSWTLGGSGRRANSRGIEGAWIELMGEGILGVPAGVTAREGRGLFLDLGREGAWRKSSGMSFQLSMAEGTGVEAEGMRFGAEADFGGGGGRTGAAFGGGGGCSGCPFCLEELGFLSQPFSEDCSIGQRGGKLLAVAGEVVAEEGGLSSARMLGSK